MLAWVLLTATGVTNTGATAANNVGAELTRTGPGAVTAAKHHPMLSSHAPVIRSPRPDSMETIVEPMDHSDVPNPMPALAISGLGPHNNLLGGPLVFRLVSNPGGDFKDDSGGQILAADNTGVNLQDYWSYHADDASFSISDPAMRRLLDELPPGVMTMSVNFVSKDGIFAAVYELLVTRASVPFSTTQ